MLKNNEIVIAKSRYEELLTSETKLEIIRAAFSVCKSFEMDYILRAVFGEEAPYAE